MSDNEPVYAPDQLKPSGRKWSRIGAVGSAILLVVMAFGNHEGNTEDLFLFVCAAGLLIVLGLDVALRRNGLR